MFAEDEAVRGFGFSDKSGFQRRFIEVQLWVEVAWILIRSSSQAKQEN